MIGIFDSGVGGLTVLHALREELPSSDIVYFGDTKNAPYGVRTREELAALTINGLKLLQDRGATNIVSACNSVSASLAVSLYDALSIAPQQLIEMVGPTVGAFKGSNARIIVCATPATIHSDIYQNAFRMIGKSVENVAIEKLAGAIEQGASETEVEEIIRDAFRDIPIGENDVLVLGCTHYPLVIGSFRKVIGEKTVIFDPAYAVAERAKRQFWPQEVGEGETKFIISKDSEVFRSIAERLLPRQKYTIEVLE
ncbi:MAG TPA: aspartate/glutamate racemase family protein [Candidatus Paceibacterota bacterium]